MKEASVNINPDTVSMAILLGTLLVLVILIFTFYFIMKYATLQRKQLQEQNFHNEQLIKLESEQVSQTHAFYQRELHDNYGAMLSIARMQLNAYVRENNLNDTALIEKASALLGELILESKYLSIAIRQNLFFEKDLFIAVEKLIASINDTRDNYIRYSGVNAGLVIPEKYGLQLYRMIQEILNNAIQHSQAQSISISLHGSPSGLTFLYEDNGVGFDTSSATFKTGKGLLTLKERAEAIGAALLIESSVGNFTRCSIHLNL